VDLDAEMAKLQAEARRELDAREAAEPRLDPGPAEPAHLEREGDAAAAAAERLEAQLALKLGKGLAAKGLERAGARAAKAPLAAQVAMAVAAVVGAVVAWKLVVKPLLSLALVAAVVLALVWLVLQLTGGREDEDDAAS